MMTFSVQTFRGSILAFLFSFFVRDFTTLAETNSTDVVALLALTSDWQNKPSNWDNNEPCDWDGINCTNHRITQVMLGSIGLKGQLDGDIQSLDKLHTLDLSYNPELTGTLPAAIGKLRNLTILNLIGCSFYGEIPAEIGQLSNLQKLSLSENRFTGSIPATIGHLSKLYFLDLSNNMLTGTIPVSDDTNPGLNLLNNTRHFHFQNNRLSGPIPSDLFSSNMKLIHVIFNNNSFNGNIPSTLGLVTSLEIIQLDYNYFTGPVPDLKNLTNLTELHLANNKLNGPLPDLTGIDLLSFVDMSNNSFDPSDEPPPWLTLLPSLTSLYLEDLHIGGELPSDLFNNSQSSLKFVKLKGNNFNGTLTIVVDHNDQLQLIDLTNNNISRTNTGSYNNLTLLLTGNPVCVNSNNDYCKTTSNTAPTPTLKICHQFIICNSSKLTVSPNCECSYPYTGTLQFIAPTFSYLDDQTLVILEQNITITFLEYNLPVNYTLLDGMADLDSTWEMSMSIFPNNKAYFSEADIMSIAYILSNELFSPPNSFGPYIFIGQHYDFNTVKKTSKKSSSLPRIIGVAAGGLIIILVSIGFIIFIIKRRKNTRPLENNRSFASYGSQSKSSISIPQLKGARVFTFDEIKKCTNSFSEDNDLGTGGYGKVYKGTLDNGQMIAVKRSQEGSSQGVKEFTTEIELLSRVHHKNLVSLVGFCSDQGEQMLVYEYIVNGSLKDSLSGKSGVRLDWKRRLCVAIGAAKGIAYLHELANPPIIHRDIKSSNVLLDDNLNAKVSDFGLSKSLGNDRKGYVTTQVKGTMGYLDPQYYMTQQLTEKSDVYSFGVLLLEIITGKKPMERGRYIVREVNTLLDRSKDLYNLKTLLDPSLGLANSLGGIKRYIDLAISCVNETGMDRPRMSKVVNEIEKIMMEAGMNPNADSEPNSLSLIGSSYTPRHPYSEEFDDHSGVGLYSRPEPK